MYTNSSASSSASSLSCTGGGYTGSLAPSSSTQTTASDPDPEILHALDEHQHLQIQVHPVLAHIGSFLATIDVAIPTGIPEELLTGIPDPEEPVTAPSSKSRTVVDADGRKWIRVDRPWGSGPY